jgi:hypothetical protein
VDRADFVVVVTGSSCLLPLASVPGRRRRRRRRRRRNSLS